MKQNTARRKLYEAGARDRPNRYAPPHVTVAVRRRHHAWSPLATSRLAISYSGSFLVPWINNAEIVHIAWIVIPGRSCDQSCFKT